MIALGIDPGSRGNCGWAVVTDASLGMRRVMRAGVIEANGDAIETVIHDLGREREEPPRAACVPIGVFGFEIARSVGWKAQCALHWTIGRWLGALEASWVWPVPVLEVWAPTWQSQYVGKLATPRTVVDPATGEKRKLLDAEKKAAKATREETYRIHAVRVLGLDPALPSDAAAAAWVACWALDNVPGPPAPKRRKR